MSLRGSETTEAIPQGKIEVAAPACRNGLRRAGTLPSVARNDKEGLRHSLQEEREVLLGDGRSDGR